MFCFIFLGSCSPNPCKNAASCTVVPYGYACTCVAGYKGRHCETGNVHVFLSKVMIGSRHNGTCNNVEFMTNDAKKLEDVGLLFQCSNEFNPMNTGTE